jgi:hypothetical protein
LVDGPVLSGAVVSKRVLLEFGQRSAAVRRGSLSRLKVAALPASRGEVQPLLVVSLTTKCIAPGTLGEYVRGQRCRPYSTILVGYDTCIVLRLTTVIGQGKASRSSCHAPAASVKPLPAAGSMRTDDPHCMPTAAHVRYRSSNHGLSGHAYTWPAWLT